MMIKSDAELATLQNEDIGHIGEATVLEDGTYSFQFTFTGFTFDEQNVVNNYKVLLNIDGEDVTPSITSGSIELGIRSGSASAQMDTESQTGTLRFTATVTGSGATNFGAVVLPLWIFNVGTETDERAETVNFDEGIASGETFGVDVTNIPEEQYNTVIYAKPFVASGEDTIWADAIQASVGEIVQ
jgi:hypothetical protein